jgi:hypothetical protein
MKIIKKQGTNILIVAVVLAVLGFFTTRLLVAQTAPGLRISMSSANSVSLTVTNGSSNGLYQIYFTEFLEPDSVDWTLFTNGASGQTNFSAFMGDLEQGFFKAVNNTNFLPPSITVIIQSPANGSVIY